MTRDEHARLIKAELEKRGVTGALAIANVLAQVEKETHFRPRTEGLRYGAARLYQIYGADQNRNKVRFKTVQEAQAVIDKGEAAIAEVIYGGRLGNDAEGDAYRYRGRGPNQLTGKYNYRKAGEALGIDLVADPDKVNEPETGAKVVAWYYVEHRRLTPAQLENLSKVTDATGGALTDLETVKGYRDAWKDRLEDWAKDAAETRAKNRRPEPGWGAPGAVCSAETLACFEAPPGPACWIEDPSPLGAAPPQAAARQVGPLMPDPGPACWLPAEEDR